LADPPSDAHTPIALRAPELILHQPFGCGIDIWSFGCLIYEFLTGEVLFAVSNYLYGLDQDGGDDEHFLQLNDIIGPLPDSVMAAWPRSTKWYGPNRQPLNPHDEDEPYIYESLENMFAANKPADIDDTESGIVCKLIRQILDFDPAKRPSAADLLKHPWFSE
jgi:non-specific serine/threonine protein kinase